MYPNNLSVFPPKVKIKNIALDYKDTYVSHNVVYVPEEIYRKFKNTKDFVDHEKSSANSCNEHEVLKICDHRCYKNRRIIFLMHWENDGAAERTWEYLEDLRYHGPTNLVDQKVLKIIFHKTEIRYFIFDIIP